MINLNTAPRDLPHFRFHPEPLKTGSLVTEDIVCDCCGNASPVKYSGPFYARIDVIQLCPWCIADGSAARRYDGFFTGPGNIKAGYGKIIPDEVLYEISCRTPGFSGAQQGMWLGVGNLPGLYEGDFNCKPAEFMTEEFWEQVCQTNEMWSDRGWFNDMRKFSLAGSVSLHVFKDLDSEKRTAYFDYT